MKLGLGVDVFNVFNTVVFGGIQTNITNANFGTGELADQHAARRRRSRCEWSSEVQNPVALAAARAISIGSSVLAAVPC